MNLENRVVVISGGTGVLGHVAASAFAEQGVRLALIGTDASRLQRLANESKVAADRVLVQVGNLRHPADACPFAQAVTDRFGRADILFHLVGGWTGGKTVVEADARDAEEMLQQHLWTTFHLAQAFVPLFVANHWGRIIVISSPLATDPTQKSAPYAIAKAAQETLLLSLAQEIRGTGVTANVIQVRTIDARPRPDQAHATWTTPEEIVAAMLYLCSDQAQVVNGTRIPLYGES